MYIAEQSGAHRKYICKPKWFIIRKRQEVREFNMLHKEMSLKSYLRPQLEPCRLGIELETGWKVTESCFWYEEVPLVFKMGPEST